MRGLIALTVAMGVMIVAGVLVVGVTIMHRMGAGGSGGPVDTVLDEPAGTHMVAVGSDGGRLAVVLSGGGPDRVVLLGPGGAVVGRVALRQR
jgi:hypothetical protein